MMNINNILTSDSFCRALGINPGSAIEFQLLGQGEYNINYWFIHPLTAEKLVLRITTGSQMHLNHQIQYEYDALKLLEKSGRTPSAVYVDDTRSMIPYGFLVMQYLPGRALKYETDLDIAAGCLADIHNLPIGEQHHLLQPESPLAAILNECHEMAKVYLQSNLGSADTKTMIVELLERGKRIIEGECHTGSRCMINTELNSGNFLINGPGKDNYLVDWEKPLFAYVGQDLGHFLAPTTTFWKTDTILDRQEIQMFIEMYSQYSHQYADPELLWRDTLPYFTMTCLRGITWCAMAWVEYQNPERPIRNQFTYDKIQTYLSPEFLERIRNDYLGG